MVSGLGNIVVRIVTEFRRRALIRMALWLSGLNNFTANAGRLLIGRPSPLDFLLIVLRH